MKELYRVGGTLNEGFVGQISYTICLEKPVSVLDIHFIFDKQKHTEATPQLRDKFRVMVKEKYGLDYTDEQLDHLILGDQKTEIHTMAMLNDEFVGNMHRQMTDRHMIITHDTATQGCIPQPVMDGVLKVTLEVFNVILDNTSYELSVSVEEEEA